MKDKDLETPEWTKKVGSGTPISLGMGGNVRILAAQSKTYYVF